MKYFWLAIILFLGPLVSTAQVFGGNPPLKWQQVNTPNVRVIFPRGLDSIGNRVASIASILQADTSVSYPVRKIDIVLQPYSTISNAYVALAPYRSELFLMTPQNAFELGSLGWADNLVIHEWRHVQQYNYFNRGLARVAGVILGQEGRALANGLAIPDWFFEGDAIWNETRYTQQGRGRLPLSFSGYKSLFLQGRHYSFMKLRNGSYKDYIPNHYDLGYLLVAYGAEKYGTEFWKKVTADASSFKPLFYPLQGAIKRHTGLRYKQFVDEAMNHYQKQWKSELADDDVKWLTKETAYPTDYLFPYATNTGNVIALKESYRHNPAFYSIDSTGSETRIAAQDINLDRYYSYKNGRIIYAAYNPDTRWGNRQFSNLVIVDVATGTRKKISRKARYFSPDISRDGNQIVAVNMQPSQTSTVTLMDGNGSVTRSIEPGAGEVFSYPKFSGDESALYVMVRNAEGKMGLRRYNLGNDLAGEAVIPFGNYILGFPVVNGDTLVFSASNKTSDAAFAYVGSTGKLYQVANYPNGLYQSAFVNGQLIASAFTSYGNRLVKYSAGELLWQEQRAPFTLEDLYVTNALAGKNILGTFYPQRFSYKKYSTLSHPFNFHSWRPYYDPPEYSFTIYGQNTINTIQSQLAYTFNENEESHSASGNLIYGGTFIQPFVGINQTWQRRVVFSPDTVALWNEFEWLAGLQLPLNLTGGKMYRFLNLSGSYHSKDIRFTGRNKELFRANEVKYLQARLNFTGQIQKAVQHIYPRFAYSSSLQWRNATNIEADQLLGVLNVYLPGMFRTHSLVLSGAFQGRDTMRQYEFTNNFPFSRGYNGGVDYPRMWKLGANYHLPLVLPDWGFANLVYFSRVRSNAFFDFTRARSLATGKTGDFKSVGGEIYFDTRWWNQLPVSFGIRYSRVLDPEVVINNRLFRFSPNHWEFILPVDLIR